MLDENSHGKGHNSQAKNYDTVAGDRHERDAVLDLYLNALGMV